MIHKGTQRLETERLILRKFRIEDVEKVYNSWVTDPNTNRFLNWNLHVDINETKATLEKWIDEYFYGSYNWVVELKDTHELIGMIDAEEVFERYNSIGIGYAYASAYWGRGYATEALKAVISFFFNECEVHLIEARHIKSNPASGRVMEKAGMRCEATLKDRRINKQTGKYDDLVIYSIINKKD